MLLLRRYLVLVVLSFWQGGFVFYASVVVPVGTEVFESNYRRETTGPTGKRQQGRITRSVARWLNVAGIVALVVTGWEGVVCEDPSRRRKRVRGFLYASIAVLLALLMWMHSRLDALFDRHTLALLDDAAFYTQHRLYLLLATVQWALCAVYLLLTVAAWRAEDRCDR